MRPEVEICIPIWNAEKTLAATLDSIRSQTYENCRVTAVNNGSEDLSGEILRSMQREWPNLSIIEREKPSGMTEDWNEALKQTNAKLIKIIAADDLMEPNCVEEQVDALEKNPECRWAAAEKWVLEESGARRRHPFAWAPGKIEKKDIEKLLGNPFNGLGETGSVLMERTLLEEVGLFDPAFRYYPDLDMWVRLLKQSPGMATKGVFVFRAHGGSLTGENQRRAAEEFRRLGVKHKRPDGKERSRWELLSRTWKAEGAAWARRTFQKINRGPRDPEENAQKDG